MKYLLSCKCGQSVEVEPGQAGQTVICACGENLTVPSMLQVKALPAAPVKAEPQRKKNHIPYRTALIALLLGIASLILYWILKKMDSIFVSLFYFPYFFYAILVRGFAAAFLCASVALALRDLVKSPLAEDSIVRRTFFIIGVALLFPALTLASYLYECKPEPRHVSLKRVFFSYGSAQKPLYQDSFPISEVEHRILWMTDDGIDQMSPINLYFYFRTLESLPFSYHFQENYEAVKDTYRIWVVGNAILFILSLSSIVASFFMPRHTVVVTGWSGSEWR
ncbi:MAG: hypothetical protein LBI05_08375 [Planctomycetaceae bacterium]|jgi:hypothetical protein|nr:hypothetical protein [Planctomycetaceae bacterium]